MIGLLLFELGSGFNLLFQNNLLVNAIVSVLLRIVFGLICFDFRPLQAACYAVVLVVIVFALELVSVFAISALTRTETVDYNSNFALLVVECASSKSLVFLTCLILAHVVVPDRGRSKYQLSLLFFPIASGICLAIFWYICLQDGVADQIQYLLSAAGVIVFTSTVLLFIIYQHQVEMESERIRIKSENERLLTEKSYYNILEQQNQQLMVYAHDEKNHLSTIQSLNQDPTIEQYIVALLGQLKEYSSNCHSGNKMLDIIINKYVLECQRRNIQFQYDVRSCNLRQVEDIDLVSMLGNLMDNALTAAAQSGQRHVTLETTMRNGYSVLALSNSCDTAPYAHGDTLLTSKEDKRLHGYGLKSVRKTLQNYGGDFGWEYQPREREFILTVMIGQRDK